MKIVLETTADKFIKHFEEGNKEIDTQMRLAMFRALSILKTEIQAHIRYKSGLNVITGTLLNSIAWDIMQTGQKIEGLIGPENVPYAAIHEEGGTIPARFVKPRLKKALKFKVDGVDVFSKGHWIPETHIEARPYLRPSLELHADRIADTFGIFILDAWRFPDEIR